MYVQFILLAVVCGYLRKFLRKEEALPRWQGYLLGGTIASIIVVIAEIFLPSVRPFTIWLGHLSFIALVWLILKEPAFSSVKSRLYIVLPYLSLKIGEDLVRLISDDFHARYKNYIEVGILFAFLWMIVMLFISNKQRKALEFEKQKAELKEKEFQITEKLKAQLEIQVAERTSELTQQKQSLEQAILDLKATQTQLIHAEKMASLGELTAGIAHEIQNPLNFVNNFSELNKDLLVEMKDEIGKGNLDEAIAIANDVVSNEDKINYHGKRADSIVKGMLQHSRSSSGQKELTDINALCDEYLRLAYHGLRAKDKSFNASFETNLDDGLPKINIMPQEMGRVLLNLINNAFYAVTEKRKAAGDNFKPTVVVSTKVIQDTTGKLIEITVKDNGDGIPEDIREKIFQPFFSTKPTGKGTGLGLSLSYDIVRAHEGQISVESEMGIGTTFIIQLPA